MENVTFFVNDFDNNDWVLIDRGNGEFTSMPKAVYEAQQVEHLTEIPTPEQSGTL